VRRALLLILIVLWSPPLLAQDAPVISLRPFLDIRTEKFLATRTFDAVFGETSVPYWGGGLQVTGWRGRIYGELGASRLLKKNNELVGQRVFVSDGQVSRLGIPVRSTLTPLEFVGGYRFVDLTPRLIPYVGAGFGSYHYTEQSDFADPSENVDVTHTGAIFQGGVEVRAQRWIGIAVDACYTHIPGILGSGGASEAFATSLSGTQASRERDLGGWAARVKIVVGR
jgi:hypothetical protein